MKKILSKYFLLSICCLGLNGCTAGAFLGAVAVGSVLLTDSNGCHSACGRSPYRSEDGKHTFNNSGETKWYDNLSQNEKDLLNRNSEICLKRINNEQKKGMEVAALTKLGWQCHIELDTPCYKYKGQSPIFNHCCRFDSSSCNSL